MFKFVAFAALLVCAKAAPASVASDSADATAQITNYTNQVNPDGSYAYQFDTSNGIQVQEAGTSNGTSSGSYQYTSPEGGDPIQVTWQADEQGFKPTGALIPQIPELIQKSLDYIAAHPPPPEAATKP